MEATVWVLDPLIFFIDLDAYQIVLASLSPTNYTETFKPPFQDNIIMFPWNKNR